MVHRNTISSAGTILPGIYWLVAGRMNLTVYSAVKYMKYLCSCCQGAFVCNIVYFKSCTCLISKTKRLKSGQAWVNARNLFDRTPSRVGHSRRAAVVWVVCFGCGVILFFIMLFSAANTQGILHTKSYMFQRLGCWMVRFVGSLDVWVSCRVDAIDGLFS